MLKLLQIYTCVCVCVRARIRSSAQRKWMMAQQALINIFVREWILQVKDLVNQVWATIDWIRTRRIRKHNSKGITLLGQVRGWSVLIFSQAFSKYKVLFLFLSDYMPPFSWSPFPYIVLLFSILLYSLTLFDPNLPLVDYVGGLLDACPIRTLLETLYVAIRLNIIVQASFPHKCS